MAYAVKSLAWTSAAAGSLALHWIGLSLAGPPLQTPALSDPRPAMAARMIEWRAASPPAQATLPARDLAGARLGMAPTVAAQPMATYTALPAIAPSSSDSVAPPGLEAPQLALAAPAEAAPVEPQPQAEGLPDPRYWPGKLLDQRPSPQAPVIIPFPPGFVSIATGRAILQLFIDELGIVDHVDVLEADGPVEFADLARKTLLQARFAPGVKNQANVRSTIKIEVGFQRDTAPAG